MRVRPREWEAQGIGNPDSGRSGRSRPMEWEAQENGRPRDCEAQRVRCPWKRMPREQRDSKWEAHHMAELRRGTVFVKYKGEAQKNGRHKKLRPSKWEARVSGV